MRFLTALTAFLLGTILFATSVEAFQSTSLRVVVVDQNSDAVFKPTVRLKRDKDIVKEFAEIEQKSITFSSLKPGNYILEAEAAGFSKFSQEIKITSGINDLILKMVVSEIKENVDVSLDSQAKSLDTKDGAFTGVLTEQDIEALPDDPEKLREELQNLAGPGAEIRVDGFSGGQPLTKDQIASIKIIRSSFDAEFHQAGRSYIDIVSRAGGSKWRGGVGFSFNDEALNARNAFALTRPPSQNRSFNYSVNGPIIKNKASLSLYGFSSNSYSTANIVAALPEGQVNQTVKRESSYSYANGKVSYNLTKRHPLNIALRHNSNNSSNFGVGGINLPERGSNYKSSNNDLRISTSGLVAGKYLHEFRFRFIDEKNETDPLNSETAIIVLDSFARGGAGSNQTSTRRLFSVAENIVFGVEKQVVKFGFLFEHESQDLRSANNQNGTFTFSSLADFSANRPATYTQRLDERRINLTQQQFGAYVQDDIRIHKTFMMNLGLRYEWQNNFNDKNNFSPRIGFSWSPQKGGKTTFRGGIGLYYNWLRASELSTILSRELDQPRELIILNPGFPDPLAGGINQERVNSFWRRSPELRNPHVFSYSLGVSRRIGKRSSLRATYSFERGVYQFRSRDINAPLENGIRPNPGLGRVVEIDSSAFYRRNSLRISFNSRFLKKFSVFGNYRIAKRISNSDSTFSLPSDNYNLNADRGASSNDIRHQIWSSFSWKIMKSLRYSANTFIRSPRPYSITTGLDNNNDTIFNDRPLGVGRNSERGDWNVNVGSSLSWTYGFGTAKKPEAPRGGFVIVSGGVAPVFNAKKKYSLQFSVNAQNIINKTNFTRYVGVQTSPFFGRPVSAGSPRRINFGIRFSF